MSNPLKNRADGAARSRRCRSFVVYLTVLPGYRQACVEHLLHEFGNELHFYASPEHLDPSVKTAISPSLYRSVKLVRLAPHGYVQLGGIRDALGAGTTVVELNPRSLTAWLILLVRKMLDRRTLVWGHVHPRQGPQSRTAALRRLMRRQARGMLAYTHSQANAARHEVPRQPVWVAPNSLYRVAELPSPTADHDRQHVLYVGRLVEEKRVQLLIEGFARHATRHPESKLVLVGDGPDRALIEELVVQLGLTDQVEFSGWIEDISHLRHLYSHAFCSVSPGFAGLGLTQSLGFGVPQLVATDQPHSPEIELAEAPGAVHWFQGGDPNSLGQALDAARARRATVPDIGLHRHIVANYSAEAMAAGFSDALRDQGGLR